MTRIHTLVGSETDDESTKCNRSGEEYSILPRF